MLRYCRVQVVGVIRRVHVTALSTPSWKDNGPIDNDVMHVIVFHAHASTRRVADKCKSHLVETVE